MPDKVLSIYSCDVQSQFFRHRIPTHGPVGSLKSEQRSVVVGHVSTGSQIAVPQRLDRISARSAVGDLELPSTAEYVGAPAVSLSVAT
jgi:hypothetical protein